MKRRYNFGRLGAAALALTLVTTCLMGGTLAKYTSKAAGTGTATVAKWAVTFKANESSQSNSFTFDLADTGSNKDNVADKKVAPGSTGSIPIEIDASGTEVAATLSYKVDISGIGTVPIKFYTDNTYATELTADNNQTKDVAANATGSDAKLTGTIYWRWDTSKTDAQDTAEGSKTTADTGTVKITMTAEQKIDTPSAP